MFINAFIKCPFDNDHLLFGQPVTHHPQRFVCFSSSKSAFCRAEQTSQSDIPENLHEFYHLLFSSLHQIETLLVSGFFWCLSLPPISDFIGVLISSLKQIQHNSPAILTSLCLSHTRGVAKVITKSGTALKGH